MLRQKSAKQTNSQTKGREAIKQMIETAGGRSLPKQKKKKSLSSNDNNAKYNVD